MAQIREYVETYRDWRIDRVVDRTQMLEGLSHDVLGFMPRLTREVRRKSAGTQYSLGLPRSLDEVKDWIDRQEDARQRRA